MVAVQLVLRKQCSHFVQVIVCESHSKFEFYCGIREATQITDQVKRIQTKSKSPVMSVLVCFVDLSVLVQFGDVKKEITIALLTIGKKVGVWYSSSTTAEICSRIS